MAHRTNPNTPKYRKQKQRGGTHRAFVEIDGQRHYLGRYGSAASREQYDRLIGEWLANGRHAPITAHPDLTVNELLAAYWRNVEGNYHPSHLGKIKTGLRRLKKLYGNTKASGFGPLALQAVRQEMIRDGLARTTINAAALLIRGMFKWAVSQELIEPSVLHGLQSVNGLRRGRTEARESKQPQAHIDAIQPHISPTVWAMIQLQLATAARPGELVKLRPIDINTTGKVWTAKPAQHKTAHHGHHRTICIGPRGQEIIKPLLNRPVDAYLFDPRDTRAQKASQAPTHRRPNQKPSPRKTDRVVGNHYDVNGYRKAIHRACNRAGVLEWSPNQLRHTAATMIRKQFGLEAAQLLLGHKRADVTQLYAEVNEAKAVEVAMKIG